MYRQNYQRHALSEVLDDRMGQSYFNFRTTTSSHHQIDIFYHVIMVFGHYERTMKQIYEGDGGGILGRNSDLDDSDLHNGTRKIY